MYCIALHLCCICIGTVFGGTEDMSEWHCVVFVIAYVFVFALGCIYNCMCVFVFALCCIWGSRGQEWAGMEGKVGQCDGGAGWNLYLTSPACRTTLYVYSNISVHISTYPYISVYICINLNIPVYIYLSVYMCI